MSTKIVVSGTGKMGRQVLEAVCAEPDLEPVGVLDCVAGEEYLSLPDGSGLIPFSTDAAAIFTRTRPDVVVDFTNAEYTPQVAREALEAGLTRAGLTEAGILNARRDPSSLAGYLELHIEQGTRLVEAGVEIGVVTGIVGIGAAWLTFAGRADHAGTTPPARRRDAAQGASAFVLAAHEILADHPGCTVNVGDMDALAHSLQA